MELIKKLTRRQIASILVFIIVFASAVTFITDTERQSLLRRGDFPGFYVLAVIMNQGRIDDLYNPQVQAQIENDIWPSMKGNFYMSVYPPYDAVLLEGLAAFGPQKAQIIFTIFMLACFAYSLILCARVNPSVEGNKYTLIVFWLCFAPLFYATFGAQNTGLSMLLYALAIVFASKKTNTGLFLSGMALGLWLCKPQFALPAIVLSLASPSIYLLCGFAIPAIFFYLLGAAVQGWFWPITWLSSITKFSASNYLSNNAEMASLIGTIKAFAKSLNINFIQQQAFDIYFNTIAVAAGFAFLLYLRNKRKFELKDLMLFMGPLLVLISPQTLFYDLGIAVVSMVCFQNYQEKASWKLLTTYILVFGILTFWRAELFLPLFFLFPMHVILVGIKTCRGT